MSLSLKRLSVVLLIGALGMGLLEPTQTAFATPLANPDTQTLHVAPSGSDFSACGSEAQPCATLQYTVNKAVSGSTLLVAAGTYTYTGTPLSPTCYTTSTHPAVLCIIDKHLTMRGGYAPGQWIAPDALANPTIIDGQNTNRGIAVLGTDEDELLASLVLEGFTVQNGLAQGATSGADYETSAYGAGIFANSASLDLEQVILRNNLAIGGNTSTSYGGAGVGAGLAINHTPVGTTCNLSQVLFEGNEARGGQGNDRGGSALGGGFYVYSTILNALDVTLKDNIARAGNTTGVGYDSTGLTADGLGGGATIHVDGDARLQRLVATGNQAIGGNAGVQAGHGQGGALFAETATVMTVTDSTIKNNLSLGGNGQTGGIGGGGAIVTTNSTVFIDRTALVANTAIGGVGTNLRGSAGGGALYFLRFTGSRPASIQNSLIADNYIEMGSGPGDPGGGGGGIWAQGVDLNITHTTFANNRMEAGLAYGLAAIFVNFNAPTPSVANISHCIFSDHQNSNPNYIQAAIYTWSGNTVNFNRSLFAANSKNFGGDGTVNGMATLLSAPAAGYISLGAPYYNYHIRQASPGRDQAVGSTTEIDIDLNSRPENGTPDLGFDEYTPFALYAGNGDGTARLNWSKDAGQLAGGVHHYEVVVTCEAGASPPDQGVCDDTIQAGNTTTIFLTGLTNAKHYTATVYAKDNSGVTIATSSLVNIKPTTQLIYLPLVDK